MALTDISIIRGDNYSFDINFKDSNGVAIDITDYEVWFTVRTSVPKTTVTDDTDAIISKNLDNGGVLGIITVELSSTDTDINVKTYKYDVQYKKPVAQGGTIHSTGAYDFTITADITRGK